MISPTNLDTLPFNQPGCSGSILYLLIKMSFDLNEGFTYSFENLLKSLCEKNERYVLFLLVLEDTDNLHFHLYRS